MSSNHHAVFSTVEGDRNASTLDYIRVLTASGFVFSGSARGMTFEQEWGDFEPILNEELEEIVDLQDVIRRSREWPCISLDARMRFWDVEVYLFDTNGHRRGHGVALYFPNAWYEALGRDKTLRRAWMRLATDLMTAGGHSGFVCGTAVLLKPMSVGELVSALQRVNQSSDAHGSALHSAALSSAYVDDRLRDQLRAVGFSVVHFSSNFEWIERAADVASVNGLNTSE